MKCTTLLLVILTTSAGCDRKDESAAEGSTPDKRPESAPKAEPSADAVVAPTEPPALKCKDLVCSGRRATDGDAAVLSKHPKRDELTVEIKVLERVGWSAGMPCDLASVEQLPWLRHLRIDNTCTEIDSLAPIAKLPELRHLELLAVGHVDKAVYDAKPLAGLAHLEVLDSRNTKLTNPEVIGGLTELRELTLNGVKPLDIGFVSSLTKLQSLALADDEIADPMPMASLPNLTKLKLEQARIDDVQLAGFASAPKWVDIQLTWVDIRSLQFVSRSKNLERLELTGCSELTSLDGVQGLTKLKHLSATFMSALASVAALEKTQLEELNLEASDNVTDVRPLRGLPLTMLDLRGTSATKVAPLDDIPSPELELKLPKEVPDAVVDGFKKRHPKWTVYTGM